jgi:DNA topoisomerase-1
LAEIVTDKLGQYFPKIMDISFTRYMEEQLDKIEEQHLDWLEVLRSFYGPFSQNLQTALTQMKHAKAEVSPSEYDCPQCGQKLVYKFGKKGRFLSCSAYPSCKFASPCDRDGKMVQTIPADRQSEHKCPVCGKAMLYKNGRFGPFLGCADYPTCKTTLKLDKDGNVQPAKAKPEPTEITCHKCKQGKLVVRQSKRGPFLGCSRFPKCRTIVGIKQLDRLKELQSAGRWPPETPEQADEILGRKTAKTAGATQS